MESIVSVIIPVYNCRKFIKKCLESVMEQSYSSLEIIVVDDGSQDGSGTIIDSVLEKEQRAKVIHQENQGVSVARNAGIDIATGKYMTFLDGDDYLGKDYVKDLVNTAETDDSDLVICGYKKVDVEGKMLDEIIPGVYIPFEHEEWACRITAIWSHLYKRDVWERYEIKFEQGARGEDVPISLFFNVVCKNIKTVQKAEYYYVQHQDSVTHNFRGLKNLKLPYQSINILMEKLNDIEKINSYEFLELGVFRFFTQCVFDLGRGAEKNQLRELCSFIEYIVNRYFPDYWKNKKMSLFSELEIPMYQKLAVNIFIVLLRFRLLYPAARLLR